MARSIDSRMTEFEAVALPHSTDLYRTAARVLGDSTKADDVVQEVYLQAWKSFHRFEPGTNCRAWLFKILFNTIHHYRRKWMNLRFIRDSEEVLDVTPAAPLPLPEKLTDQSILAALEEVPPDFRSVVILSDLEEFAYKEIAGILQIPIGTVMSRLSRGRKLLREKLAGVAPGYGVGRSAGEGKGA